MHQSESPTRLYSASVGNLNEFGFRIGIGHDTHRLEEGGPLRIGGVEIDFNKHLVGHSDADVLLHAITDAILGAARLGDIGTMFPNTDPANKNRNSIEMLKLAVVATCKDRTFEIVNIDCIVFAEQPKLSPYRESMLKQIAAALDIAEDQVWVKAKTGEGIDAVGRGEAICAQAIVLANVTQ